MMDFIQFSTIVEDCCHRTTTEFLSLDEVVVTKAKEDYILDDVAGPSIEVKGEQTRYLCLLEYKSEDNLKILDMFQKKYPFLNSNEVPEIDLLDLFGEYLNILCGKINKEIDSINKEEMNIEIPYFEYGIDKSETQELAALNCQVGTLSFKLHYLLG